MGDAYKIAILAGDAIGPEIMAQAVQMIGANPSNYMWRDHVQNCSGQMSGFAHSGEPLNTMFNNCFAAHCVLSWSYEAPIN